jgi:hypothetical protein
VVRAALGRLHHLTWPGAGSTRGRAVGRRLAGLPLQLGLSLISRQGSAERRQPPAAGCTGARSSRAGAFQFDRTGSCCAGPAGCDRAAATAMRVATSAAISSAVASPRTT